MSRIIYYIGAGASCGNKNTREIVYEHTPNAFLKLHEGLPIVSEIPLCLLSFKDAISKLEIDLNKDYIYLERMRVKGSMIEHKRQQLIESINELYQASVEHATIDTYAKKLTLVRDYRRLKELKNVLCAFFLWVQLTSKPDQRYDTFLANMLQMNNLFLPKEISVISWNYDSQFEIVYQYYSKNGELPIYEKADSMQTQIRKDMGVIFKVNGSANFGNFTAVKEIAKDKNIPKEMQVVLYYGDLLSDTSQMGYQFQSQLSFAWEQSPNEDRFRKAIGEVTQDTETVIVIGYSFPFCNREIDRQLYAHMPNLKRVYIQDPHPESVEPAIRAVLPENFSCEIFKETDCTQFLMPREL